MQAQYDQPAVEFELNKPPPNPWSYPTVAAVGPKGQISIRHLTPGRAGEIGDSPIGVYQGQFILSPRYRAKGWVMYEDLCRGIVPGVDGDADAWQRWQNIIALRARGGDLPPGKVDESAIWHPEVTRRQERDGGPPVLTADGLRELLPGIDIPDDKAAELDAAAAAKGKAKGKAN